MIKGEMSGGLGLFNVLFMWISLKRDLLNTALVFIDPETQRNRIVAHSGGGGGGRVGDRGKEGMLMVR